MREYPTQHRGCAWLIVATLCAAGGWPAPAYGAHPPLELLSPAGPQVVELSLRAAPKAPHTLTLSGRVFLTFENDTRIRRRVVTQYISASTGVVSLLPETTVGPIELKAVELPFELPATSSAADLAGALDVHVLTGGSLAQEYTLPVRGIVRPIGDIRFSPAKGSVQITKACLFRLCNAATGGSVELTGPGVGELITQLRTARVTSVRTQLSESGRPPIDATLSSFETDPATPQRATAKLTVATPGAAGKYSGRLALSELLTSAASWPLEVKARVWVVWAVLSILVGVVVSALVTQQLGLERRKRLLRRALREVVDAAARMRGENRSDGDTLIWSLNIHGELVDNPKWTYYTPSDSAANVYTAVRWARNDRDLDEAQHDALELMAGIKDWQAALAAAKALQVVREQPRPRQEEWRATKTAFDSDVLMSKAHRAPADENASVLLVQQLRRQAAWLRDFTVAWDLRARLLEIAAATGDPTEANVEAAGLIGLDTDVPPVSKRTEDEQDEWEVKLARANGTLLELSLRLNADRATPDVNVPEPSEVAAENAADAARFEAQARALRSAPGLADVGVRQALVEEIAAPASAGGAESAAAIAAGAEHAPEMVVAAGPAAPRDRLARALGGARRALMPLARRVSSAIAPPYHLRRLWLFDWLTSLAIMVISSIVYTATAYTDTWGTVGDFATAFGAGFSGHVAIKWALLPIYRSIRLRAVDAPKAGS
jgi:hypothetical protein